MKPPVRKAKQAAERTLLYWSRHNQNTVKPYVSHFYSFNMRAGRVDKDPEAFLQTVKQTNGVEYKTLTTSVTPNIALVVDQCNSPVWNKQSTYVAEDKFELDEKYKKLAEQDIDDLI